ncbi:MAG: glycosyltransferase, partial [Bacteroidota bacterium]
GPERPALEQRAQELGLSNVLTFRGELSRTQVMETMARSKVLFHPSQYESFGFVYAEALQAGMAIISRPTGVAAEGPGWHLASTAEDLTKALLDWFAEPRSLSRSEPFPLAATVEAYREVYAAR